MYRSFAGSCHYCIPWRFVWCLRSTCYILAYPCWHFSWQMGERSLERHHPADNPDVSGGSSLFSLQLGVAISSEVGHQILWSAFWLLLSGQIEIFLLFCTHCNYSMLFWGQYKNLARFSPRTLRKVLQPKLCWDTSEKELCIPAAVLLLGRLSQ